MILKHTVGVEVSKDTLGLKYGYIKEDMKIVLADRITLENNSKGFKSLLKWINKVSVSKELAVSFIMEATGVYYENLAYYLSEKGQQIAVVLPKKAKNYFRADSIKSKTDKIDAEKLCRYGLEKQLELWKKPSEQMQRIKRMMREVESRTQLITLLNNQIHAIEHSHKPEREEIKRNRELIKLLRKQIDQILKEARQIAEADQNLRDKISRILKIEGVGYQTALNIMSETNGFENFESAKQLTSYAGLDVVHSQSGKITGKTYLSKKGNNRIRTSIYMPTLSAILYNPQIRRFYIRLITHGKLKKVALLAAARKLLVLIYTIWNSDQEYNPNYGMVN